MTAMLRLFERAGPEAALTVTQAGVQSLPRIVWISSSRYVAVWTHDPREGGVSNLEVRARIFDAAGAPAGAEFAVNTSDGSAQTNAVVAKLAEGGFVIAWEDRNPAADGDGSAIRFRIYSADGAPLGGERIANSTAASDQSRPTIAGLEGGGFVIAWTDASRSADDPSGLAVRGQLFSASGDLQGSEFLVNSIVNRGQTAPHATALPGGGFAILWQDESPQGVTPQSTSREDLGSDIALQIFDAGANKVGGQRIVDELTPSPFYYFGEFGGRVTAMNPVAVVLPSGRIAVTWTDAWDGFIKTRQLNADGTPATAVFNVGDAFGTTNPPPAIIVLADGGYAISWTNARTSLPDSSGLGVLARVFAADGTPQGLEFQVNERVEGDQLASTMLALPDGGFLVAWHDGGTTDLAAQRFRLDSGTISDIGLSVEAISKNSIGNVQAAILSANGALNAPISFELLDDPTGAFRIEGDRLVVSDTRLLNGFAATQVTLTFRATDSNGNSHDEAILLPLAPAPAGTLYEAGPQFLVTSDSAEGGGSDAPEMVALPDGGFFLTWSEYRESTGSHEVMGQFYEADGSRGASFFVNTVTNHPQVEAIPTLLANGNILVTWTHATRLGGIMAEVRGQILSPSGERVGGEIAVNSVMPQDQSRAQPTALADGGFLVTWTDLSQQNDSSSSGIKAQFFSATGAKVRGEFLVNTTTAGAQNNPSAAQSDSGTIMIVWSDASASAGDTSGTAIKGQLYTAAGLPLRSEFLVNTTTLYNQEAPLVTALAGGRFVVVWRDKSEGTGGTSASEPADVRAQIYDAQGHRVGSEILVNSETLGVQGLGHLGAAGVAAHPDGGFVITWSTFGQVNSDGSAGAIKAQRFGADGTKIGGEFLVNAIADNHQSLPAVAVLADGDLMFVWWDGAATRATGVYAISGRRFAAIQSPPTYNAIEGTSGGDLLVGTDGRDAIYGYGDGDSLFGRGHDDLLDGGEGNDLLHGEEGDDSLIGGGGNDDLRGGSGVDSFDGGPNDETFDGAGGFGDRVSFDDRNATQGVIADLRTGIISNDGFGNAESMVNIESFGGGTGYADTFYGNDNRNFFVGGGSDSLYGFGGDDLFFLNAAARRIDGGDGVDTVTLSAEGGGLRAHTPSGIASVAGPLAVGWFVDLLQNGIESGSGIDAIWGRIFGVENVTGSALSDQLIGSHESNVLLGGSGDDILFGRGGDDRMAGEAGDDGVVGEDGNDSLSGGEGNDILRGGAGVDSFDGGAHDERVSAAWSYADRVTFAELKATRGVVADLRDGKISDDGFGNSETMIGIESLGAGTAFADLFHGNDGRNSLSLSRGDTGYGHGGDDLLVLNAASALADGGDGADTLVLLNASTSVYLPDSNGDGSAEVAPAMTSGWVVDLALGTALDGYGNSGAVAGVENVIGSALADRIHGSSGSNIIEGRDGDDVLRLDQGGNDTARGGSGKDAIIFGSTLTSADIVDGGSEVDQLSIQGDYWGAKKLTLGNVTNVEQIILLAGSNTAFGDPGTGFYSYELTTQDLNVAAGGLLQIDANQLRAGENFTFNGAAETDGAFFIWGGKGVDLITTGAGNDGFLFRGSGNWGSSDVVNAGAGIDQVGIRGNYVGAGAIVMGAGQLISVEQLVLMSGSDIRFGRLTAPTSYDITMNDANVASGQRMTVDAASLREGETLTFNASAELDGAYTVFGGRSADTITGGAGADVLRGARGGDTLTGGEGADRFVYRSASESTGVNYDTLVDLSSVDRIDLPTSVSGFAQSVTTGQLNNATFDADLAAALDGVLEANQAVLFTASSGDHAGKRFLIVDGNGDGAYTEGTDYVFALGATAVIDTSSTAVFV